MGTPLAVLIVEDSESDAALIIRHLSQAGYEVTPQRVEDAGGMGAALEQSLWDLVIADYNLPQFDASTALRLLQATGWDIPFIVVSGNIGEEIAVAMMKDGAHDYLLKNNLARLVPAVKRELDQARLRREQRRAEAQLRLQSAALNAAANAIVITDQEGSIQWVNPAFCDLTGYTTAEVLGKNPRDLVKSGQHPPKFYKKLWETILAGQVWRGEIINRRKDGSLYFEEETITPLRNGQGQISHFIAIKQDITGRKQLEMENVKLTAQFHEAQKMESMGQLAGGIAHDFNNLLVPIIGYASLGMKNLAPDSELYDDLTRIKTAGKKAAELIRLILAFSQRQTLAMETVDLNEVIGELLKMLRRLIGEDIEWQVRLAPDLPRLKADKGQLERVLMNLVVNARDAMPQGGKLTLETTSVALDEAAVAGHIGLPPGTYALLTINDTGHGIDAATQQRIFEPFFTTKEPGRGTGLGLATVYGIVKQHGGDIWVDSEPGVGTTFKIYLPPTAEPASTPPAERAEPAPLYGTETVLVVEDEAKVRQLVSQTLKIYGYQVLEAPDPAAALTLAAAYPGHIQLLLTDVIMPEMNGWELYQRLSPQRSNLKVLYMSGYSSEIITQHNILIEGAAFLQKPFTIESLLQQVRAVLG